MGESIPGRGNRTRKVVAKTCSFIGSMNNNQEARPLAAAPQMTEEQQMNSEVVGLQIM